MRTFLNRIKNKKKANKRAIDSEAMRARGIIVLVKCNYCFSKMQLVGQKNIETKYLSLVKARLSKMLFFFRQNITYINIVVAQLIRMQH